MKLIPFSYNRRSLLARGSSTVLTLLSVAATVAVLAGMLSLRQGFLSLFQAQGSTDVAVFLRPGANSEGESGFRIDLTDILIKGTPEILTDADGPLASAELYLAVRREKLGGGETNVAIRGVQSRTFDIHDDDLRVVEGERFNPGSDEVIVGSKLVERIRDCRVGDTLVINTTPFRVVGVFDHDGPHSSEIWGDVDRMREALDRAAYSRIIAKLRPGADVQALSQRLETDRRVPAKVQTEREYLEAQTSVLSGTLLGVGVALAAIMGLAAVFTGTNAMLAAISARTREIGILLALGFRPWAIFVSFLGEAVLLGLIGGVIGCVLALPLHGIQTGTTNWQSFTEVAFGFRLTPSVLGQAVLFAMLLGLLGGAIPAWRAARMKPTDAVRRG